MKYLKLLPLLFIISNSLFASDDFVLPISSSSSLINGKSIVSRVSLDFIDRGGTWEFGSKLKIDLKKLIEIAKSDLQKQYDKPWSLKEVSFSSNSDKLNKWYVSFLFQSTKNDYAVIQCNLKGEVWPIGKISE